MKETAKNPTKSEVHKKRELDRKSQALKENLAKRKQQQNARGIQASEAHMHTCFFSEKLTKS